MTDIPQLEDEENDIFKVAPDPGKGSCNHKWTLDKEHSSLLEQGKLPTPQAIFSLVAHCSLCRSQFVVMLDFMTLTDDDVFVPCPNMNTPLHHFVHRPKDSIDLPSVQLGAKPLLWFDRQIFQCSSPTCAAKVSITFRPARLQENWIRELTDRNIIKERAERAFKSEPERFEGHAPPSAVEVLGNLRTYIVNGMQGDEPRKILGANKKWLLCFGDSCHELLQYIGFQRDVSIFYNRKRHWRTDKSIRVVIGFHLRRDRPRMPLPKKPFTIG